MSGLVNQQTGMTEDIPDGSVEDSVTSGEYSPPKMITLIHPTSGEAYNVSNPEKAKVLLANGWMAETKDQLLDRAVKDTVSENPVTSSVAAFAGQFTNSALLGIPKVMRENGGGDSEQQNKIDKSLDDQLAEQHPVANIAGGVMGTAATLLLTPLRAVGIFGDAVGATAEKVASLGAEKGVTAAIGKIAGTAAKFGAENAVINIPRRVTEEVLGDPQVANESLLAHGAHILEGALEDATAGAEIGGAFSLGSSILGPILKGAAIC
jgi:hypothetical protein